MRKLIQGKTFDKCAECCPWLEGIKCAGTFTPDGYLECTSYNCPVVYWIELFNDKGQELFKESS